MRLVFTLVICVCFLCPARAANWAQWRGPNRNNIAPKTESVPSNWSASQNVRWKVNVPGRGHSSPIVVGDLIVLTTADETNQVQGVIAFDRMTGKQRWITQVSSGGFPKIHVKNTHASSTVAHADAKFFATFCHHGQIEAAAINMDGNIVWQQMVGPFRPKAYEYGYASSPTVYRDSLIVCGSCDTSAWMKALDLQTGKQQWQQQRPKVLNWASPIVTRLANRDQLLISGGDMIASYDPNSGQPAWSAKCLTMATAGTCVWTDDGIVLASGGYPASQTAAVASDGSGTVLWTNPVRCYEQSTLCHNGYLYALADNGVAYCWNATTGQEQWKKRLRGPVSASPLLVGGNIYVANEKGTMYVFRATPDAYEPIAKNQLGKESFASPAVADDVLYLRVAQGRRNLRQEVLYAIAE